LLNFEGVQIFSFKAFDSFSFFYSLFEFYAKVFLLFCVYEDKHLYAKIRNSGFSDEKVVDRSFEMSLLV